MVTLLNFFKREIVWIPIIGCICLVVNFPRLRRDKINNNNKGESDVSIIQKASKGHGNDSGALLIFPEGTRFSEAKKTKQNVPYHYFLKPKTGGLKMIKQHANADTNLVDITINYHKKMSTFGIAFVLTQQRSPLPLSISIFHRLMTLKLG
jgi:1-acyl-sn-glycerol-3-phosphate acyltransferase